MVRRGIIQFISVKNKKRVCELEIAGGSGLTRKIREGQSLPVHGKIMYGLRMAADIVWIKI